MTYKKIDTILRELKAMQEDTRRREIMEILEYFPGSKMPFIARSLQGLSYMSAHTYGENLIALNLVRKNEDKEYFLNYSRLQVINDAVTEFLYHTEKEQPENLSEIAQ